MDKLATAVYHATDRVGSALQEAFHASSGRHLTMGETQRVLRAVLNYRGLSQKLRTSPETVAKLLFGEKNTGSLWYYPCDTIELRGMFERDALMVNLPVLLLSQRAAFRIAPEYPLLLAFNRDVQNDGTVLGGAVLIDGNRLSVRSSLNRIMIREHLDDRATREVYRSVHESGGEKIPVYLSAGLPGLTSGFEKKLAGSDPLNETVQNWRSGRAMPDSMIFMSPDRKHIMLSVGDADGDYEEHQTSLQEAVGKDVKVEVCDECGKPDGYDISRRESHSKQARSEGGKMAENWYERSKGPADSFGKEFVVGKQPKIPDPDEMKMDYVPQEKAISLKQGDRVAYRYTDVKLPVHNNSGSLPFTRSLVQRPKLGTIQKVDAEHIHVLWDGSKEPQKVPIDQNVFLVKVID